MPGAPGGLGQAVLPWGSCPSWESPATFTRNIQTNLSREERWEPNTPEIPPMQTRHFLHLQWVDSVWVQGLREAELMHPWGSPSRKALSALSAFWRGKEKQFRDLWGFLSAPAAHHSFSCPTEHGLSPRCVSLHVSMRACRWVAGTSGWEQSVRLLRKLQQPFDLG